jgi:hypothetical protein
MSHHGTIEQPTLTIPFQLRGYPGQVAVSYGINQDPKTWGFSLFGKQGAPGYPICLATVEYPGPGYHALMGWLQLVAITQTQQTSLFLDTWPMLSETDTPFAEFGYLPTFFDAPSPDPALHDQTWRAETFLVVSPDVFFTRSISRVVGFCWGYSLTRQIPTITPIDRLSQARWEDHLSFLRKRCPSWEFLSGEPG